MWSRTDEKTQCAPKPLAASPPPLGNAGFCVPARIYPLLLLYPFPQSVCFEMVAFSPSLDDLNVHTSHFTPEEMCCYLFSRRFARLRSSFLPPRHSRARYSEENLTLEAEGTLCSVSPPLPSCPSEKKLTPQPNTLGSSPVPSSGGDALASFRCKGG